MAAGADTSSSVLPAQCPFDARCFAYPRLPRRSTQLWVLKFLSENPIVQQKLHDELVKALPAPEERAPTLDELNAEHTPCPLH